MESATRAAQQGQAAVCGVRLVAQCDTYQEVEAAKYMMAPSMLFN